jgi:hypothetical protein
MKRSSLQKVMSNFVPKSFIIVMRNVPLVHRDCSKDIERAFLIKKLLYCFSFQFALYSHRYHRIHTERERERESKHAMPVHCMY